MIYRVQHGHYRKSSAITVIFAFRRILYNLENKPPLKYKLPPSKISPPWPMQNFYPRK